MIFQVKFLSPDLTSALVEKRAQALARLRPLIGTFSMRTGDHIMMMMLMTMMRIRPMMMRTILSRCTFPYIILILFIYMRTGDEDNHDVIVIAVACPHITHISHIYILGSIMKIFSGRMLGLPRLRQLRVQNLSCEIHPDFQVNLSTFNFIILCFPSC